MTTQPKSDRVQSVLDHLATKAKKSAGSTKQKKQVWMLLEPEVYDWYKAMGDGWKERMYDVLRKATDLDDMPAEKKARL